jgi:serine-type D-Ala-D-Ala carboxypeptidase/endopeptidase (penicillin-binding protein 4)
VLLVLLAQLAAAADRDRLLYHVETLAGDVVLSHGADVTFNPASVVKAGTSLWALERLGAGHRYATVFASTGLLDRSRGRIVGSLVVEGGGDPDFQVENALLVVRALNRMGVREVTGDLLVEGPFFMGWENGMEGRRGDPARRLLAMGERLRAVLEPARWQPSTRSAWLELCARHGLDDERPPRLRVDGAVRLGAPPGSRTLLVHRSNPLVMVLKRFNTYSNNDLIRVADTLGGVGSLEAFLRGRLGAAPADMQLATASGQGRNRITPRLAVDLIRELGAAAARQGLGLTDLLPVPGCDPGPTRRMFPKLVAGPRARSVVCKTGTLTTTDGGVVVLAGAFTSPRLGTVLFCVAAPRSDHQQTRWRRLEQEWLLGLVDRAGGAVPFGCKGELPFSDSDATVEIEPAAG